MLKCPSSQNCLNLFNILIVKIDRKNMNNLRTTFRRLEIFINFSMNFQATATNSFTNWKHFSINILKAPKILLRHYFSITLKNADLLMKFTFTTS